MPFSRGSSQPRDQTVVFCVSCTGSWILYQLCHLERPYIESIQYKIWCVAAVIIKCWCYTHPAPQALIHTIYTTTQQIFLKTTDTVASSDERTWTLGIFVPSNLSHVGAIFIAEASCYSLPEEIAKLFSHLPSSFSVLSTLFLSKSPWKKIAWLCFLPGVGAGHGCLEDSDLLEESKSARYS